ncbi:MAG: HD domain-containing protein [Pirellulales bacterium]|nr:HD domain-containing protein [Pirellulales bacterium]
MSTSATIDNMSVADSNESLLAIPLSSFRTSYLQCDIYIQREKNGIPVLYRRRSHPLEEADLERLHKRGIRTLYISKSNEEAFRRQIDEEVLQNESIPLDERYRELLKINEAVFVQAFRGGKLDDLVRFSDKFACQLSELVCRHDLIVDELFAIMEFDNGTYTHSVNVATYCLLLADRLGITDTAELKYIAAGALLHDIGKRHVQLAVLNSPSPLTAEQRKHIQQHPTMGFRELALRKDQTWGQMMMTYEHHERVDGSGYPTGIKGNEIHPWARICSIADVFHALTSKRPYKAAMSTDEALAVIKKQSGTSFDMEMVKCWNTTLKKIPCLMA